MSKAKAKGTAAESAVVKYLSTKGFPLAERRALTGALDQGDITGTPCLAFEIKNHKSYKFQEWLRESEAEKNNAGADFCPLIVKPNGVGLTSVGDWFFVLTVEEGMALLHAAGYGSAL